MTLLSTDSLEKLIELRAANPMQYADGICSMTAALMEELGVAGVVLIVEPTSMAAALGIQRSQSLDQEALTKGAAAWLLQVIQGASDEEG